MSTARAAAVMHCRDPAGEVPAPAGAARCRNLDAATGHRLRDGWSGGQEQLERAPASTSALRSVM